PRTAVSRKWRNPCGPRPVVSATARQWPGGRRAERARCQLPLATAGNWHTKAWDWLSWRQSLYDLRRRFNTVNGYEERFPTRIRSAEPEGILLIGSLGQHVVS